MLKQHHSNLESLSTTFNAIAYETSFILFLFFTISTKKKWSTCRVPRQMPLPRYLHHGNWHAPLSICAWVTFYYTQLHFVAHFLWFKFDSNILNYRLNYLAICLFCFMICIFFHWDISCYYFYYFMLLRYILVERCNVKWNLLIV